MLQSHKSESDYSLELKHREGLQWLESRTELSAKEQSNENARPLRGPEYMVSSILIYAHDFAK